jgi:glycerophosphoryl diester phosphodiesterase
LEIQDISPNHCQTMSPTSLQKGSSWVKLIGDYVIMPVFLLLFASCSFGAPSKIVVPMKNESRPLIIAHRGARSLAPENTLAAARKALELGADMWELDVAITSDNELVVVHDDTLERTCDVKDLFPGKFPWRVWEFTLAEIKTLDCGSWFNQTDPFDQIQAGAVSRDETESYMGEPMPTFRQALAFTHDNNWRVNVELKEQPNEQLGRMLVEKTVNLIDELGMDERGQVVVSSFNHEYLKTVHSLNPDIPIQALTDKKIDNLSEYLAELGTDTCNPKVNVWSPEELGDLGQSGIQFNVWTVNDEAVMRQLIAVNVHGIFTDFPQLLERVLNNNQ